MKARSETSLSRLTELGENERNYIKSGKPPNIIKISCLRLNKFEGETKKDKLVLKRQEF